jgi:hypothetical protein
MVTVIKADRIITSPDDPVLDQHQLMIEDGIIKSIEQNRPDSPSEAKIIDLGQRTVLPGLIDSHVHTGLDGSIDLEKTLLELFPFHVLKAGLNVRRDLEAGFTTLRLGLETAEFDHRIEFDKKVSEEDFNRAIICLKEAGFRKDQIGAYLLVGLPEQSWKSIEQSIRTVRRHGITPILAYYTPIPHTALWPKAVASSRYDLESDPMVTNNAIVPCRKEPFSWEQISYLKKMATD